MFATIYLPNFYLQAALRHQPDLRGKPAAIIQEKDKKPVIIQLNVEAESAGITRGQTPSQALARCLQVAIKVREPTGEQSVQQTLLQFAFTLSPLVEATGPGIATVQFTNNRDLKNKLSGVITQLAQCEIEARAGIAHTPDLSFLAAHLARPLLQVENVGDFLAPLPIEALAIA